MARSSNQEPPAHFGEGPPAGPIFDIAPATRAGMHILIQVYGPPECGKTLTGLMLARGLAGPSGKIGVIDTEGRAGMFAGDIAGGFLLGQLTRPFTPRRYLEGTELFLNAGVDAMMIDSFSHVWEGFGGVLDQAEQSGLKGLAKWNKPKREYNRMISMLLTTRIPLIFCSRAKQPMLIEEKVVNGKKTEVWTPMPWEPIQDKRLKYEMTITLPMTIHGRYTIEPPQFKCPRDLRPLFTGEPISIETGSEIRRWVDGADPVNHAAERIRRVGRDAAEKGQDELNRWYRGLDRAERALVDPIGGDLRSAAIAADEQSDAGDGQDDMLPDDPATDRGSPFGAPDTASGAASNTPDRRPELTFMAPENGDWAETERRMEILIRSMAIGDIEVFRNANATLLDEMRRADKFLWSAVLLALSQREPALKGSPE